jgi:glycine cleavage system H protein
MTVPRKLRYTATHEWIRPEGELITVGITDYAQEQLSDITYVELPKPNDIVAAQEEVAVVESVKAASDVYAPVDGTIVAINEKLLEHPELINSDPYEAGWLFKMRPDDRGDVDTLFDAERYEELLPDEDNS